jgi:hypothetical protein
MALTIAGSGSERPAIRFEHLFVLLLMCVVATVYTASYAGRPAAIEVIDAVADTDAQPLARLIRGFALDSTYGDATRSGGRRIEDIVQAHKVKHLLFAVVGHAVYRGLGPLEAFGLTEAARLRAINALLSAVNVALFALLLRALGVPFRVGAPLTVLFAFAASPWIIGAVPESWTLSGTVVLSTLVLSFRRAHPLLIGVCIGIGMLNNFMLAGLVLPCGIEALRQDGPWRKALLRGVGLGAAAAASWVVALLLASRADPNLRPDRALETLLWFRDRNAMLLARRGEERAITPYVIRVSAQNALVGSVVANQSDIDMPGDLVSATLRESWLGRAGTALWVVLGLGALAGLLRRGGPGPDRDDRWRAVALISFVALEALATLVIFWPSEFLYSVPLVPVLLAFAAVGLARWRHRAAPVVLWCAIAVIVATNAAQVSRIRRELLEVRRPSSHPALSPASPRPAATIAIRRSPSSSRAWRQGETAGGFIIA